MSGQRKSKSSTSKANTYKQIVEFWDTHDLADYWAQTEPAELEFDLQSEATFYPVDVTLSAGVLSLARMRGVSPETLINLWIQEKLQQETAPGSR